MAEMTLARHDHMIKALASDRADQSRRMPHGDRGAVGLSRMPIARMRGAPQKGFAKLISRISCRTSRATLGLPDKAIEGCEGRALGCAATQYIQLVSMRDYLSFERTPRGGSTRAD
jgi:hypothetical protein